MKALRLIVFISGMMLISCGNNEKPQNHTDDSSQFVNIPDTYFTFPVRELK